MQNLIKSIILVLILAAACSCEKKSCPKDMHEMKLENGSTICVPNHLNLDKE